MLYSPNDGIVKVAIKLGATLLVLTIIVGDLCKADVVDSSSAVLRSCDSSSIAIVNVLISVIAACVDRAYMRLT